MTTFQDPPPHSRRAVRQSERAENALGNSPTGTETPVSTPDDQQAPRYVFDSTIGHTEIPSSVPSADAGEPSAPLAGRRARVAAPADADNSQPLANQPPPGDSSSYRIRDYSPEGGRRSATPSPTANFAPPAPPVPLDYQTQGVAPGAGSAHSSAPAEAEDSLDHTLTRRELREMRAAAEAQSQVQVPVRSLPEPIDTLLNSGPIDIPTLAPPPGQSQALAEAMAEFDLLTRSRREAEARARDAQVASLATPIVHRPTAPVQPYPLSAPPSAPPASSVPSELFAQPASSVPSELSVPSEEVVQPEPTALPDLQEPPVLQEPRGFQASAPQPPVLQPPVFPQSAPIPSSAPALSSTPAPSSAPEAPAESSVGYPPTATIPSPPQPLQSIDTPPGLQPSSPQPSSPQPGALQFSAPQFSAPQANAAQPSAPQPDDQHGGRSPRAAGHWRVQAAIEDDELPYENTLGRTVGATPSAITTSALVLPSVPDPGGILNARTATGEILVTGTIDLPKSLGQTGAHPSIVDNSDYEDDPLDSQVAAPDSAPIRAIRAISTNTSTRGVIETTKPQGTRMLTAVIVVASVLCVGLVGLLVFAFASGKL